MSEVTNNERKNSDNFIKVDYLMFKQQEEIEKQALLKINRKNGGRNFMIFREYSVDEKEISFSISMTEPNSNRHINRANLQKTHYDYLFKLEDNKLLSTTTGTEHWWNITNEKLFLIIGNQLSSLATLYKNNENLIKTVKESNETFYYKAKSVKSIFSELSENELKEYKRRCEIDSYKETIEEIKRLKTSHNRIFIPNQYLFKEQEDEENSFIKLNESFKDSLAFIDLSNISFDNVDVRNIDFRDTNISFGNFNPKKVAEKDLSGCNFSVAMEDSSNYLFNYYTDFTEVNLENTNLDNPTCILLSPSIKDALIDKDTKLPLSVTNMYFNSNESKPKHYHSKKFYLKKREFKNEK